VNGFIKDGAHEAVDDAERRRIRGIAAQSLLLAFQLFAANVRKIDEFVKAKAAEKSGNVRKLPSRRRTKSLTTWARTIPATDASATSSGDPDPPLIA